MGVCTYCGRATATAYRYERPTCPETEAATCFTIWEKRAETMFNSLNNGNDHGK